MIGQKGYSLVELMVTVVVVFLVASIGVATYTGYLQTARQQTIVAKVEQFRMFQDSFRTDNGRYVAGAYTPDGGFVPDIAGEQIGYVIGDDSDGISFEVEAGTCGNIANCYRVVATDGNVTGTWESGNWTWVE